MTQRMLNNNIWFSFVLFIAETSGFEEMSKEIDTDADLIEEEDPNAYGVTIRAATLDKLAEYCLEEFGKF